MTALLLALALAILPPCAVEDDAWCVWDATGRGNGVGRSVIALGGEVVVYLGEGRR